jgi:two-component system response regulator LytT
MEVKLICSSQLEKLLSEYLAAHGFTVNTEASISVVEKGFPIPSYGISIIFEYSSLHVLTEFIEANSKKTDNKAIIIGKHQDNSRYEIIPYEEIMYFEGQDNAVFCISAKAKFQVKNKLYELESLLTERGFVRISKASIVNIMNVTEIIPWFASKLLLKLKNNHEIEVTRSYLKAFKDFLDF